MTTQDLVSAGRAMGLLVYDERAAPGRLTPRLFALVRDIARHDLNPADGLTEFLVPAEALGTDLGADVPVRAIPGGAEDAYRTGDARDRGTVPPGGRLVAGLTRNGKVILGTY